MAPMRDAAEQQMLTVLVVEDDGDTRRNLCDILELRGHTVLTAPTISEALGRSDWSAIDVVLIDRRLPDGTAEDLLPRLAAAAPAVATIIVTGYGDLDSAVVALKAGASDYILKPINPDALYASLRRIAELRLARARILQSQRLAAMGEAMAQLAHESRSALHRISAGVRLVRNELEGNERGSLYLEEIEAARADLLRLFDDVLQFAAPIQLEPQRCDVSKVWRDACHELRAAHPESRVTLQERVDGVDLECLVDPFRIKQIFLNLFDNSLAARGDLPLELTVSCEAGHLSGEPAIVLSVADNGPGLTPEQRKRIFNSFYTTKSCGTGLGMAIVHRIVKAHGGDIYVADRAPGTGAEFVFTIPTERR